MRESTRARSFKRRGSSIGMKAMDFPGSEYYKLNRLLLLLVGLWPYDRSAFKYFQRALCNGIVMFTTIGQIAKLKISGRNVTLVMKVLSPFVMCLVSIIKYQTFCIIPGKIRYLVERIGRDWSMLKDAKELEIMQKYAYIGSTFTFVCSILGAVSLFVCILSPMIPFILDVLVPLNVSRPRELMFPVDFFVDEERYFYAISLHLGATATLMLTILLGTETLYVMCVQHVCAMFRVASYRINQAFDENLLQSCASEWKAAVICKKLTEAVYIHRRALEFNEFMWSSLVTTYSVLIIIGIVSLVINLFCLFQSMFYVKKTEQTVQIIFYIIMQVSYFFMGNFIGQILIDHSVSIFDKTYFTQWYRAPWQVQRLLMIIMQRSMKSCKMVLGGVFTSSMEGFASVMSTTMSYFMVLWSVQK